MRNHKTGCNRCSRKVCCCPRPASSCICPPGPPGPQGPAGPAGSDASPTLTAALYKWSGLSAGIASTPAQHSDNGDDNIIGATRIEYPVVGDQVLDAFRVNLLSTLAGEDAVLTFTLYLNGVTPIATVTYVTGETGQKTDLGPFVLADGDTISLESTETGDIGDTVLFTAVLR